MLGNFRLKRLHYPPALLNNRLSLSNGVLGQTHWFAPTYVAFGRGRPVCLPLMTVTPANEERA
jgi:hypothetical protein